MEHSKYQLYNVTLSHSKSTALDLYIFLPKAINGCRLNYDFFSTTFKPLALHLSGETQNKQKPLSWNTGLIKFTTLVYSRIIY